MKKQASMSGNEIEQEKIEKALGIAQFTLDHAVEPIFWIDQEAKFIYVNEATCRLLGYSGQEMLALKLYDIDPNYSAENWPAHWRDLKERGSVTIESRHISKAKTSFPVKVTFNYLEYEGQAYNCAFVRNIAWRRWTMEELIEREQRFQHLISSISDHIYVTELSGEGQQINTYISPNFDLLTGYPIQKFIEDWNFWQTLIHPDDRPKATTQFERLKTDQSSSVEYRLIRADGQTIWLRDSRRVIEDEIDGQQILTIYGVLSDITERKQAEEVMRESRERFRRLVEYAPEAIVIVDEAGQIVLVNIRTEEMFGYQHQEIVGQNVEMLMPQRFRAIHLEHRQKFLAKPGARPMGLGLSLMAQRKDGSEFPVEIGLNFTESQNERLIVSYITDITARKQIEQALHDSEEYFRSLIENASDVITILRRDGLIRYESPAVERILGYTIEELEGQNAFDLVHPDDLPRVAAAFEELLQQSESMEQPIEYRFKHKDGSWRTLASIGKNVLDNPLVDGVVVNSWDITDLKQTASELALARDRAIEANRLKSELLAKVSHELRTPLSAILGFAEMLELGLYGAITDAQKEPVSEIVDSTNYLTTLVNELLDEAQLEAGRLQLNMSEFNPIEMAKDVKSTVNILAQTKGLRLTIDIATDMPNKVVGDEARTRQILVNLLSNAIKFTDAGSIQVCLYRPEQNYWTMQVSDTGLGISSQDQQRIFEAFQQVDGSMTRTQKGYGLGLSIVKQLTHLMGGEITLESQLGQGSTFTLLLPIQPTTRETK